MNLRFRTDICICKKFRGIIEHANQMALIPDGGMVSSRLCTDDWARIVVPGSTSQTSVCRVRVSRKLTAEEIAALPPRHRP